jgi:hypothetical protein
MLSQSIFIFIKASLRGDEARKFSLTFFKGNLFVKKTLNKSKIK